MSAVTTSEKLCKRNKKRSFYIRKDLSWRGVCWDYVKQGNRVEMPGSFSLIHLLRK